MKKYFVIGNPIDHSLSPKIHNYWFKKNGISATYEKKKLEENELDLFFSEIKKKKIDGANVTVPFKRLVIPYLDQLTPEANATQSVNTIYIDNNKICGHNTDIEGFEKSLQKSNFDLRDKKILVLGAGGVVPSIVFALKKMKVQKIIITNRTKSKAESIKRLFKEIQVVNWGFIPEFDMIINATSLGLNNSDKINLNFSEKIKNKFFYDIVYKPEQTNFLKMASKLGNKTENGKTMFVYQALAAFKIWHNISPEVDKDVYNLLND